MPARTTSADRRHGGQPRYPAHVPAKGAAHGQSGGLSHVDRDDARAAVAFLLAFALLSFAYSSSFGVVSGRTATVVGTPVFLAGVAALVVWLGRRKAYRVIGTRTHVLVMSAWATIWVVVQVVGVTIAVQPLWWVLGGLAMAAAPVAGAMAVARKNRAGVVAHTD